ncbi:unnamed protein product [Prorocentrum cordatum]|uniref:Peptidylprolyl isomerase n=1 Tax=Prorocentrum cordatum TaxID=2364126 RepID=A0ABN9V5F3_9DINO|nr:unnamed protein product [Polarella glacialis]
MPARVFHSSLYQMAEADSDALGRPHHIRHSFQGFDASEYEWDVRAAAEKDAEDDVVIARGSVEHQGDDSKRMTILIAESIPFTKGAAKGSDLLPLFKDSMHNKVVLPFEIVTKIVDSSLLTRVPKRDRPSRAPAAAAAASAGAAASGGGKKDKDKEKPKTKKKAKKET